MTAQSVQRFCIRLDPAMLLEGLLLERLERVPKARRQEWLRGLLVNGYLTEARTARNASVLDQGHGVVSDFDRARAPVPWSTFASWRSRRCPPVSEPRADDLASKIEPPAVNIERPIDARPVRDKPFAHLRKVIG
jgi:hypothetical protein